MDYGGTEYTVSKNMGVDKETARMYIDKYWAGYAGQAEFNRNQLKFARKNGYVLSLMGHKRHLKDINSDIKWVREKSERFAMNAPIQGGGNDVISTAQVNMDNDLILKAINYRQTIQVYD